MKRKMAKYISGVAVAAVIVMLAGFFQINANNAAAGTTISYMPKTDKTAELGTTENPFTILEIVPNKSMGMIGYMIPGCEPVNMEALSTDRDLNSDVLLDFVQSGIFSGGENQYQYAFYDGLPAGAEIFDDIYNYPYTYGKWCLLKNTPNIGYFEYGYYEYVGAGNGTFEVTEGETPDFTASENGSYNWVKMAYSYLDTDGAMKEEVVNPYEDSDVTTDLNGRYWTTRMDDTYYRYQYFGYYNMDMLISSCFENKSSYEGFVSQVITVTPDQLTDENLGLIKDADLINITAQEYGVKYWIKYNKDNAILTEQEKQTTTFSGDNGNDLSWNATLAIVERMASDNPAAMLLQFNVMCGTGNYNMEKLYIMLMQYGAKGFWNTFVSDTENFKAQEVTVGKKTFITGAYRNSAQGKNTFATTWNAETFMTDLGIDAMHESVFPQGTSEVFGTILTYNGDMSMLRDFWNPSKITEIKTQGNAYYKPGSNSELFDYYQEIYGTRPNAVSMGIGVNYIIAQASGKTAYKQKLHVLELQPCDKFIYGNYGWELYYANLFPWFMGDFKEDLTVTTMTTYQFIGDIADLNSEYDLIFIGEKQDNSNGLSGYNDPLLNSTGWWENGKQRGLLYTSIGDLVIKPKDSWDFSSDYWTYKDIAWSYKGSDASQVGARYSGNDLTKKKYEELRDYLAGGNPIVMASGLFAENGQINSNRVDSSSYVYQLGSLVYRVGSNESLLFRSGYYKNADGYDRLKGALAKEKCGLSFIAGENGYPTEYVATTQDGSAYVKKNGQITETIPISGVIVAEQYNQTKDEAGNPQLRYEFTIAGDESEPYEARLYIDRNGDGIFSGSIKETKELAAAGKTASIKDSEEVWNLSIADMTTGEQMPVTDGILYAGHTYLLTRTVPTAERGILPWKLEVHQKNNDSVRSSKISQTAIEAKASEKVKIEVLQMNLMPDMKKNGNTYVNFADKSTQTGAKFDAYLSAVEDFNVHITYLPNSDWYAEYGEQGSYAKSTGATKAELIQKWENTLEDVDMLVIGYCDMAAFTEDEVFYEGFLEFVNAGKSVILGHDLVKDASFYYREPETVSKYDASLRTLAGQRRRYYVSTRNDSQNRNDYAYSSTTLRGQSINLVPKVDMQIKKGWWPWNTQDISNIYQSKVETNQIAADSTGCQTDLASEFMDNSIRLFQTYVAEEDWPMLTETVTIANQGQITSYPYALGETIEVSATHAQNFQLDLEQEDGGDITVWYNLSGGEYTSWSKDARNSYYIYTKGNITYTGLGHSNMALTDDEVKLFVNTMISAYRTVPQKPYIQVKNEDASEKNGVYTMYVMLTGAEKQSDTLPVNFKVVEESLTEVTGRTYYLQYQDSEGNPLQTQIYTETSDGSQLQEEDGNYKVVAGGNYTFYVPCQTILEEGEAVYYLDLSSLYQSGNEMLESHKVTKVIVYAMPLFSLH